MDSDRTLYQLPKGYLVLSRSRQAKKLIQAREGLSSRQFRRLRKQLMRDLKLSKK